jgi:hypothetical protein
MIEGGQVFESAKQILGDWAVGSQTRKMDEWLSAKAKLTDDRMGLVVALATHQRHALDALFDCDFLRPVKVLGNHPMICSKLESEIYRMYKGGQSLALTGTLPWLFTCQAIVRPTLQGRAMDVWQHMVRGIPYVGDRVAEMGSAGSSLNLTGFDECPEGFR